MDWYTFLDGGYPWLLLQLTLTMPEPVHGDTDSSGDVNLGDTLTYTATAATPRSRTRYATSSTASG